MHPHARQPTQTAWSLEQLRHERAIALGFVLEPSSIASYTSALHSYVSFCNLHSFPIEPTAETLSFFVVFMSHHVKPSTVAAYLSGICSQLESIYPSVRTTRRSDIITRTLTGCTKLCAIPTKRQVPVSFDEMGLLHSRLAPSDDHDTLLFLAIVFCSFHALLRMGESVWPDNHNLRDYRKVVRRSTATVTDTSVAFTLPSHKADRLYEGNKIMIVSSNSGSLPITCFRNYLVSRDTAFPLKPELWLRKDGSIPTRSWMNRMLALHFPDKKISGHSFRPGGATYLALKGVPSHIIQMMGRWKSDTFQTYIRQHPSLLAALLYTSVTHTVAPP